MGELRPRDLGRLFAEHLHILSLPSEVGLILPRRNQAPILAAELRLTVQSYTFQPVSPAWPAILLGMKGEG